MRNPVYKGILFLSIFIFFIFLSSTYAYADIVYVTQDIVEDTTWTSGNEYIICEIPGSLLQKSPVVKAGITLTIEEGAVVKFDSNRVHIESLNTYTEDKLVIEGNINANGVTFTALSDYWGFIEIVPGEVDVPVNVSFTNCIFEKGGKGSTWMISMGESLGSENNDGQEINLKLDGCTLKDSYNNSTGIYSSYGHHTNASGTVNIRNTVFSNLGYGILLLRNYQDDIDVVIDGSRFTNLKGDTALLVQDSDNVTITNNTFMDIGPIPGSKVPLVLGYNYSEFGGYHGGYAKGQVIVTDNTFIGNEDTLAPPIEFHAAANINPGIVSPNNRFPGYSESLKYIRPFLHVRKNDTRWGEIGLSYLIDHDIIIGVQYPDTGSGGSLTIDPGLSILITGQGGFYARNNFTAIGTKDKPITFDTVGQKTSNNRINIDSCLGDVILKYCKFSNMEYGVQGGSNPGVYGIKSFIVENSSFSNMNKSGIYFYDDRFIEEGKAWIKDSIFENNGEHGLYASSWSGPNHLEVYNSIFRNNTKDGVYLEYLSHLKLEHCLIYSNGENGVNIVDSYNKDNAPYIINCTVAKNGMYGLYNRERNLPYGAFAYGARVINSIISGNGKMDMYNQGYDVKDGEVTYSLITESWHYSSGRPDILGIGCITKEALFADIKNDDFHLKSDGGRWDGSSWIIDSVSSPCIDAGDPQSSFINEVPDNGGRINMGYYGNTSEASKKPIGTIDTDPPTWPDVSSLVANNIMDTRTDLSWTPALNAVQYRVYEDFSPYGLGDWQVVATVDGEEYSVKDTDYLDFAWGVRIKVEAIDSWGNRTNNGPIAFVRVPRPEVIITLDSQGGELSTKTVIREINSNYEPLPKPTKPGYKFDGWYFNSDGSGEKIGYYTTVTLDEDHTLYANWIRDLSQYEDKGRKTINDDAHEWTIEFSKNISFDYLISNKIYILDELNRKLDFIEALTDNGRFIKLKLMDNERFEFNQYYTIIIENNVQAEDGTTLDKGVKMQFIVIN